MWCSQKAESNTFSPKMAGAVKPPDLVGSGRTNFRSHSQGPQPLSKRKWCNPFSVKTASSSARTSASASSQNPRASLLEGEEVQSQVLSAGMLAELAGGDLPETQFAGGRSQVCSHPTSGWPVFGNSFPFRSFLPCVIAPCHCTADYVRFILLRPPGTLPCTSDTGTSRADTWLWLSKHWSEPAWLFPKFSKITLKKKKQPFYTQTNNVAVTAVWPVSRNTSLNFFKCNLKFHFSDSRATFPELVFPRTCGPTSWEAALFPSSSSGTSTAAPWPWSEPTGLCFFLKNHWPTWCSCVFFKTQVSPLIRPVKGKARVLDGRVRKSAFSYAAGPAMVRKIAEADVVRLRKYEIPIKRVARNLCLDPALIAAIMSQESRVGLLLDNGWDQERHKYGLMQVHRDDKYE